MTSKVNYGNGNNVDSSDLEKMREIERKNTTKGQLKMVNASTERLTYKFKTPEELGLDEDGDPSEGENSGSRGGSKRVKYSDPSMGGENPYKDLINKASAKGDRPKSSSTNSESGVTGMENLKTERDNAQDSMEFSYDVSPVTTDVTEVRVSLDFNPDKFIDRFLKVFPDLDTLKNYYSKKGVLKNKKAQDIHKNVFSSPLVHVDFPTFKYIMAECYSANSVEMVMDSPTLEDLRDSVESNKSKIEQYKENEINSKIKANSLSQNIKSEYTSSIPQKALLFDKGEELDSQEDGPVEDEIHIDSNKVLEAFGDSYVEDYLRVDNTDLKDLDWFSSDYSKVLRESTFSYCKKFNCTKFKLCSTGDFIEGKGEKATEKSAITFVPTCKLFNKEGCPQSKIYSAEEKVVYEASVSSGISEEKAHETILTLRKKKLV